MALGEWVYPKRSSLYRNLSEASMEVTLPGHNQLKYKSRRVLHSIGGRARGLRKLLRNTHTGIPSVGGNRRESFHRMRIPTRKDLGRRRSGIP